MSNSAKTKKKSVSRCWTVKKKTRFDENNNVNAIDEAELAKQSKTSLIHDRSCKKNIDYFQKCIDETRTYDDENTIDDESYTEDPRDVQSDSSDKLDKKSESCKKIRKKNGKKKLRAKKNNTGKA